MRNWFRLGGPVQRTRNSLPMLLCNHERNKEVPGKKKVPLANEEGNPQSKRTREKRTSDKKRKKVALSDGWVPKYLPQLLVHESSRVYRLRPPAWFMSDPGRGSNFTTASVNVRRIIAGWVKEKFIFSIEGILLYYREIRGLFGVQIKRGRVSHAGFFRVY